MRMEHGNIPDYVHKNHRAALAECPSILLSDFSARV
jgi:hypothetical protein